MQRDGTALVTADVLNHGIYCRDQRAEATVDHCHAGDDVHVIGVVGDRDHFGSAVSLGHDAAQNIGLVVLVAGDESVAVFDSSLFQPLS